MEEKQQFYLDLCCTGDPKQAGSGKVKIELFGSSRCNTIGDLKQRIEEQHDIPIHLMKLIMNSANLADNQTLDQLKVNNGDTFVVQYYSKADCQAINTCITVLNNLTQQLEDDGNISSRNVEWNLANLGYRLFLPWLDVRKYANKLYFVSKDGLVLINKSLRILLDMPRESISRELQKVEGVLLVLLWNITEDAHIRRAVVRAGGLESCIKALVIKKVVPSEKVVYDFFSSELIRKSLGVFANLSELPEIRLTIASNKMVMEQMYSIVLSRSFQATVVHSIVMIILVLGYTPDCHTHLILHPSFGEFVSETYKQSIGDDIIQKLLRYHLSLVCALLLLKSPQYFTEAKKSIIKANLQLFIAKANPIDLSECENSNNIVWDTLTPHIQAVYQPDITMDSDLTHVCKYIVLIALHTMIHREFHRSVLLKEDLVDYFVCMPWHQNKASPLYMKAMDVLKLLKEHISYQPPSLLNMCKAAVAVYHCGLHDVMRLSVPELTSKIQNV